MRKNPRLLILALLLSLWAPAVLADSEAALKAMAEQSATLLLRHAQTVPGTGDPVGFRLEDCSTQRNLNDRGRADAKALGQALRDAGVRAASVYASPWCRAQETAALLDLGPVEVSPLLASTWNDRIVNPNRAEELRLFIRAWQGPGPLILVSHGINVRQLLGRSPSQGGGFVVLADPATADLLKVVGPLP